MFTYLILLIFKKTLYPIDISILNLFLPKVVLHNKSRDIFDLQSGTMASKSIATSAKTRTETVYSKYIFLIYSIFLKLFGILIFLKGLFFSNR